MFMTKRMSQNECNITARYLKWGTVKEKDIFAQNGNLIKFCINSKIFKKFPKNQKIS